MEQLKKEITIPQMLQKLDEMYVKQNDLQKKAMSSLKELAQIQEDIEVMEMLVMHRSNKMSRENT